MKRAGKLCILMGVLLIPALFSFSHPFYMSVTTLHYNNASHSLEGTTRVFINDLEDAFSRLYHNKQSLATTKDTTAVYPLMRRYLKERLSLKVNGRPVNYHFLGYEVDEEALLLYTEVTGCAVPTQVDVKNRILFDFLAGQMNIVKLEVNEKEFSSRVVAPDSEMTLSVN